MLDDTQESPKAEKSLATEKWTAEIIKPFFTTPAIGSPVTIFTTGKKSRSNLFRTFLTLFVRRA